MIYEINLWLSAGHKYNGTLNINRGDEVVKFSRMHDLETFIAQGTAKDFLVPDAAEQVAASMDPTALYSWLADTDGFVIWNPKNAYAELSVEAGHYKVPLNKTYRPFSKSAPVVSFRVEV